MMVALLPSNKLGRRVYLMMQVTPVRYGVKSLDLRVSVMPHSEISFPDPEKMKRDCLIVILRLLRFWWRAYYFR